MSPRFVTTQLTSSWNKGYLEFINDFVIKAEVYNETQPLPEARLNQTILMTMLQRAVSTVHRLAEVQVRECHAIAEGRPAFTYDVYVTLLKAEAERLDKTRKQRSFQRQESNSQRRVNETILSQGDDDSDEDAVTYEVFKAMMKNKRDG